MINKKQMPALLWAFFIAILCGIPGRDLPIASWLEIISFDKFVHAFMFFILAVLSNKSWNENYEKKQLLFISIFCIAYGILLEILQGIIFIERSADLYDVIANSAGVLFSVYYLKKKYPK
jgi:hypothetical protein